MARIKSTRQRLAGEASVAPRPSPRNLGATYADDDLAAPWLVVIFYAAVWLATWALAHHILGLAITVGTAFVIVPGLYVLLRIRVERVAQWLHLGRQG